MNTGIEIPKVTPAEIADWEENFRKTVTPLVKFDIQDNGHSMKFYNGESGIDAYWSGTIVLKADNYIKWSFSVLNGAFIEAKFNIDDNNRDIPAHLYDFYKNWEKEVAKTITEPEGKQAEDMAAMPNDQNPLGAPADAQLAGPESANVPKPDTAQLSEGRRIKGRERTIMDSSERMRRLAGL